MKENIIKVVTLVVLIVLVVVTFKLTGIEEKENNNDGNVVKTNSTKIEEVKQTQKEDNKNIISLDNDEEIDIEDIEKDEVIIEEDETNLIKQYKIYNKYVVTSENTQYKDIDYKYFIISSKSQLKNFIENYFVTLDKKDVFESVNDDTINTINEKFDDDFFKGNSVIIISDYNNKKQINGTIDQISKNEDKQVDIKIKKITNNNLSNGDIFIVPVEKGIKDVKISHIN